jgi:predicted DsbA family dithiol-disulfide isomerase
LAGKASLTDAGTLKAVEERLARYVDLYRQAGAGGVPKLLFGKYMLSGVPDNADVLEKAVRQIFAAEPET